MISFFVTLLMIIVLFFSGKVIESIKRAITLVTNLFLKLIDFFNIKIKKHEQRVIVSSKFREVIKDVRIIKKSKQNDKMKKSINLSAFILMCLSIVLIVVNLKVVSDNCISKWLFQIGWFSTIITTQTNMDTTYTAAVFSVLSFSSTIVFRQWIETKDYRKARRQIKEQRKIIDSMSSKQMLDITKTKDAEQLNKLIESDEGKKNV